MVTTRGSQCKESDVTLRGVRPTKAKQSFDKKVSNTKAKTKKLNDKKDSTEQKYQAAKAELDNLEEILGKDLRKKLKKVCGEGADLVADKDGKLRLGVLPGFKNVYKHLEMGDYGGSCNTTELRNNENILRIDDKEASLGMRLTGRLEMKPNQVAKAESAARHRASRGGRDLNTWGYEKTSKNCSITQKYRHAMGAGLSEHIAKKKKNVLDEFPEMAEKYSFINITDEGEGVEIHAPGDDVP